MTLCVRVFGFPSASDTDAEDMWISSDEDDNKAAQGASGRYAGSFDLTYSRNYQYAYGFESAMLLAMFLFE